MRAHRTYRAGPFAGLTLPVRALSRMLRERDTRGAPLLVASILLVGTVFYVAVEPWSVVDAFYFSVMTLATVGFGDLTPSSDGSKLFTVVYTLVGIGLLVTFFSELARQTLQLASEQREAREAREARQGTDPAP